jgi:hypothetical protein
MVHARIQVGHGTFERIISFSPFFASVGLPRMESAFSSKNTNQSAYSWSLKGPLDWSLIRRKTVQGRL